MLFLIAWHKKLEAAFPGGVGYTLITTIDFGNSQYTGGGAAEQLVLLLANNFNWTINDGGTV